MLAIVPEYVTLRNIKMLNAQNGARIKAWAGQGVGSGIVKNITFTGFTESNVDNPIIIDQVGTVKDNAAVPVILTRCPVLYDRCRCMRRVSFQRPHTGCVVQQVRIATSSKLQSAECG